MAHSNSKYADFERLREQAVALRPAGYSLQQILGESYRGCLVIKVLKGAELYRRIEGSWYGIVLGADSAT